MSRRGQRKSLVEFGSLGRLTENDEGSADILVDGNDVGYITRVVRWDKFGSSRKNIPTVLGYTVGGAWVPELEPLEDVEFKELSELKDAIRKVFGG